LALKDVKTDHIKVPPLCYSEFDC